MVITEPMPSMPLRFWDDPDGQQAAARPTSRPFPGFWRQGDLMLLTDRGTAVMSGRSDATINRGGVRIGTSELYAVVEELPEVADSLVVHREDDEGGAGELILFVALAGERELDDALSARIAGALRSQLSPRHVPDAIVAVPSVPRTMTGKKLEAPVKRILLGARAEQVASRDSLVDPEALDAFVAYAAARA